MYSDQSLINVINIELSEITSDIESLNVISKLRKKFDSEFVNFIIEQSKSREKAKNKLPIEVIPHLLFDKTALEQASTWPAANHRVERIKQKVFQLNPKADLDCYSVYDLGSGIGIDTLALSGSFLVNSYESEQKRFELLKQNNRNYSNVFRAKSVNCVNADFTNIPALNLNNKCIVYLDPSRRDAQSHYKSILDYQPSLEIVNEILKYTPYVVVKISPSVDLKELLSFEFDEEYEIEFISERSELKECVLWFGFSKRQTISATILPENLTYTGEINEDYGIEVKSEFEYLYEPDFALIRSGLMEYIAADKGLIKIDSEIAYLGGKLVEDVSWCKNRTFFKVLKVIESIRYENIIEELLKINIEFVDLKKRGYDIDLDKLQLKFNKQLKKNSVNNKSTNNPKKKAVLLFTYVCGKKVCIVTEKVI
jgi:tRNA1(Val) A37 N6-methylase TrmN6